MLNTNILEKVVEEFFNPKTKLNQFCYLNSNELKRLMIDLSSKIETTDEKQEGLIKIYEDNLKELTEIKELEDRQTLLLLEMNNKKLKGELLNNVEEELEEVGEELYRKYRVIWVAVFDSKWRKI